MIWVGPALLACLGLQACDASFDPFQEPGRMSVYGALDASADTQWMRITPVRHMLRTTPDPLETTVTLQRVGTGRTVELRDSIVAFTTIGGLYPEAMWYTHNYWTTEPIELGATYTVTVTGADRATATVTDLPIPKDYSVVVTIGGVRVVGIPYLGLLLLRLYLEHFDNDLAKINSLAFRNLAFLEHQYAGELTADIVKWLLLSEFCTGGELNKAQRMLQELKTLYILNAHDFSIAYLDAYRSSFRMKDEEFIKSLENDELHSALLFYIAHAFTSLALMQGRGGSDLVIEYANLDQAIDLNGEALYFNPRNGSALRLVDTQAQILQYALARSQKRWENINQTMGQRFQFYEEYLRQEKSTNALRERLTNLKLDDRLPELKISRPALARMSDVISEDQRDRLKHRVEAT